MWKKIKNWFNKPKIKAPSKPRMDFSDIKFDLNIRSICYFEKLTNKSFFTMGEDDIFDMFYSIYMANNPDKKMRREVFMGIIEREDIFSWMMGKYLDAAKIWSQFKDVYVEENKDKDNGNVQVSKMCDYVSTLIIEYGVDAHYIYYEMDMWEIAQLFDAIDNKVKRDLEMQRFWTYLNICPHIDSKKVKSPEQLIPFEWEKEEKHKKQLNDINNNAFAVKNLIGRSLVKKQEDNG